ncbi:MAG TPA: DUF2332 domain-containing protein [Rhizomicrobium sp.]|jgi:hypothetical protein
MSEKTVDYWDYFAQDAARTGSAMYARLAQGTGGDGQLRAIAALAKPGQPHANLLLAAVHFLLQRGAQHLLRAFYPDLNAGRAAEGDPFPAFRDFVLSHRAELEPLIATRVTNTNEVGRSAVLHPGFRALAQEAGAPLNLIEIGPSAGLNLIWDRYGVNYNRHGKTCASIAPDAPLVIECELRGEKIPPTGPSPRVNRRMGLELNPVDLSNADDRDWLRALMWPDQIARLDRLDKAVALFREHKPEIRAGDALALLADALREMPENETVCIYHTIAVYQFSREMKETLHDILTVAGLRRPVHRLSFEAESWDGRCPLTLIRYHDGTRSERELGHAHPHGTWLEWTA